MARASAARASPARGASSQTGTPGGSVAKEQPALGAELVVASGTLAVGPELSPDQLLHLQRTAGNRAVTAAIQRAPGDEDDAARSGGARPVPAGATTAMGGASSHAPVPVPAGATTAMSGASSYAPVGPSPAGAGATATGGPATGGPAPAGNATGALAQPYASGSGGQVPPGFGGNIDLTAYRRELLVANAIPEHVVESTFRRNPAAVIRSPHDGWHADLWNFMRGVGTDQNPPPAFKVGNLIAVAPGHTSPATPLPQYRGDDRTGLGAPGGGPPPLATGPAGPAPGAPAPERPMTRAVAPAFGGVPGFGGAPGFSPGPQPPGRPTAQPVSTVDVLAALKADSGSVYRSPNAAWHAQGFQLDQGKGSTAPTAYRIEGRIFIAPDHPIKGVPTLAIPAGPGAAGASAPPAAPAAPGPGATGAAAPTTETSTRRVKRDLSATKGKPGVAGELMVEDVTTSGDTTTKRARGATASIGGGNVAAIGGQGVTTETKGDTSTTTKTAGNLTLKPDGSLVLGGERSTERFAGKDEAGNPIRTGATSTSANVGLGEKGLTGQGGATRTTEGGTKHGVTGTGTIDSKGNVSGQLAYKVETKGGTSLTPSVSGGVSVKASDPIPAEGGGFDVTYTVTTSSGASLAGGKQMSGGPSVGLQVGTTEASLETGTKHFDDEKQAKAFRDKAATVIARERIFSKPPTTVEGALQIKIGEERGSGEMSGSSMGGSVAFQGASLGYGESESTTHQFKVRRISEKVVHVTGSVSGTTGSDVTGSGGITLTKGSSETKAFEVVWEFDLGTRQGRAAFERYAKNGLPPVVGATMKSMTSSGSEEDHDNVTVPLLGTARWTGTTWEVIKSDTKGGRKAQFGGQKAHNQDPSWIGKNILGQDKLASSAQITSSLESGEGGEQEGFEAQVKVSSDSGEYNRKALGEMFMGVRTIGEVKPSGEWTLSAQVSPKVVRELGENNREMRNARTKEDKLRIYAKLVKENGARMVGAQVGQGGDPIAWSLELKGDKNFPGPAGRAALDAKRAELRGRLKDAAAAKSVVSEAQKTLDELRARRIAVANKKRYTDLPDGLRDQQLKLIDKHITDFEFIRHNGLRAALKRETGRRKPDAAKAGVGEPGAGAAGGYTGDNEAAESADMLKLRAAIDQKETAISALDPRISRGINAVTQARSHTVNVSPDYAGWVREHRASYSEHWALGIAINDRQFAMARNIDALRQKLLESMFAVDRKAAAEALLAQLTDRLALLETLHMHVVSAAEAIKPITTRNGMKGYPRYWGSIKGDEPPWLGGWGSDE